MTNTTTQSDLNPKAVELGLQVTEDLELNLANATISGRAEAMPGGSAIAEPSETQQPEKQFSAELDLSKKEDLLQCVDTALENQKHRSSGESLSLCSTLEYQRRCQSCLMTWSTNEKKRDAPAQNRQLQSKQ